MKRFLAGLIASFIIFGSNCAYAGEIDILLDKLVDKGVLTPGEAQQINTETKEQVKQEISAGKYSSLPQWVQNTKLKGDFRLRFQNQIDKSTTNPDKDKNTVARIRMRLGLESKVNEKVKAGIGIATGSGDPRSTNVTLGGSENKKTVILDYAYGKYEPFSWLNFTGGKMLLSDVLWEPTDLIWDTDVTPEGAVIGIEKNINPNASLFLKAGGLIIVEESNTVSGSNAYLFEPGINYKINDNMSLKGAVTLEYFQTKGTAISSYSKGQNTRENGNPTSTSSSYSYNYSNISPALEFSIKEPFKAFGLNVENLKLYGEYVNNMAVTEKNTGFSCGFQFGNEKIEKWGDWQFRYVYAMLGQDAAFDLLPDSDRLSGKTGMRSHEGIVSFGLGKNTFLSADVYRSWSLVGAKVPETLVQVDWNMKF